MAVHRRLLGEFIQPFPDSNAAFRTSTSSIGHTGAVNLSPNDPRPRRLPRSPPPQSLATNPQSPSRVAPHTIAARFVRPPPCGILSGMVAEGNKAPESGRVQFSLFSFLLGVAALALLLVARPYLYDFYYWYFSIPLSDEVAAFNARSRTDFVGMYEPPITEDEIVTTIRERLPNLNASNRVKGIYARIADTRRLPRGATLQSISRHRTSGEDFIVWWINLSVMTGNNSGYGLRIRENNYPSTAARKTLKPEGLPDSPRH